MSRHSVLFLALALVATACGDEVTAPRREPPQAPRTIEINGEAAADHGTASIAGQDAATLVAGDFYFEPTVLTGEPGQVVQVAVRVVEAAEETHNLTLTEQEIDQDLGSTDTTVELTFPRTGVVAFFCKYHRDRGMLGALAAA